MKRLSGESDSNEFVLFYHRGLNLTDCLSHIRDNCVQSNFAMDVLNRLLDVLDTPNEPGRLTCSNMSTRLFASFCVNLEDIGQSKINIQFL